MMKKIKWNESYSSIISKLQIDDLDKETLRIQWLTTWSLLNNNARHCQKMNTILKLAVFISGVLIPIFSNWDFHLALPWVTLNSNIIITALGIIVAVGAGINQQLKYEERWTHFRRNAELLRNEGENFFGLGGAYKAAIDHKNAYRDFNTNVGLIKRQDVQNYFEKVVTKDNKDGKSS